MSTVAIRHEESWHVQVTRDEGDDWPDMEGRRHTRIVDIGWFEAEPGYPARLVLQHRWG